jgi:hypothetical protein
LHDPAEQRRILHELENLVGPHPPMRPPFPAREEPFYDTRYQPPDEGHLEPVGMPYDGQPDDEEPPIDYTLPPRPPPRPLDERGFGPPFPRPPRPEQPPTYEQMMRVARQTGALTPPSPAGSSGSGGGAPPTPDNGPAGAPDWPTMPPGAYPDATAFADAPENAMPPAAPMEGPPNAGLPPTGPEAFPGRPPPDLDMRAEEFFDQQMRDAFVPPPDPYDGMGGLEQQLFNQQIPPMDLPPDPGPYFM